MARLHIIEESEAPRVVAGRLIKPVAAGSHAELAHQWISEVCAAAGVPMPAKITVNKRRGLRSDKEPWVFVQKAEYEAWPGKRTASYDGTKFWIWDKERYEAKSRAHTSGKTRGNYVIPELGQIILNYGTDWADFQMVILHECAHWIGEPLEYHGAEFFERAFSLYERYGLDMARCIAAEVDYKPGAATRVAARRAR